MVKRILAVLIFASILIGALVFSKTRHEPLKVSGFVEAHEIRVGSRVGGRVAAVRVAEGDIVTSGAVLIELEPHDLPARRAQVMAEIAARQADLSKLQAGFRVEEIAQAASRRDQAASRLAELEAGPRQQEIDAARARMDAAQAAMTLAEREHARIASLRGEQVVSQNELDRATENLSVSQANLKAAAEALELLRAGTRLEEIDQARAQLAQAEEALNLNTTGFRVEEIAAARAALDGARASLDVIDRQIAELVIRSPLAGRIEAVDLRPGDLVQPNAPVLSIMDLSSLWVRAYVPENQMDIQPNQPVPVSVDSFPNRYFRARITFVARQAEFTPSNVQTPEDRSRQVFRIKATLDEGQDVLRPGMAADVWLEEPPPAAKTP